MPMLGGVYIIEVGLEAERACRVLGGVFCGSEELDASRAIAGSSLVLNSVL